MNLEDVVFDEDFSILVDSVIEGKASPNTIGYKTKDGIASIFEIFQMIVKSEEQKVRECVEFDVFDSDDILL